MNISIIIPKDPEKIMSNTPNSNYQNSDEDDLLPEYNFDYSQARPNRFAGENSPPITVTLDADVAEVFTTSEAVNHALRTILSAIPKR